MSRARDTADTQDNVGGAVAPFVAGKNKIINGDFGIWQRGTSFSTPNATFTADRWFQGADSVPTTWTISQQTFTPGTAPVAGYEGTYFYRSLCTTAGSATIADITNKIEDVRTFAGQTVTLSFWAKADTTRTSLIYLVQVFGTGGSSGVVPSTPSVTFTNTWQRFTFTMSVPSVAGKTIGAGSYLGVNIRQALANGSTLDIWGVQLEAGNVATPFTTASGSIGGELALCQRYYYRMTASGAYSNFTLGMAVNGGVTTMGFNPPVTMRVTPTAVDYSTLRLHDTVTQYAVTAVSVNGALSNPYQPTYDITVASGLTQYRTYYTSASGSTSAYIGFSAEL